MFSRTPPSAAPPSLPQRALRRLTCLAASFELRPLLRLAAPWPTLGSAWLALPRASSCGRCWDWPHRSLRSGVPGVERELASAGCSWRLAWRLALRRGPASLASERGCASLDATNCHCRATPLWTQNNHPCAKPAKKRLQLNQNTRQLADHTPLAGHGVSSMSKLRSLSCGLPSASATGRLAMVITVAV